jgi:hypothetical protein
MSSGYSPWPGSPEHQRHYCWRHNEADVVEYQWPDSSPRMLPAQTTPRPAINLSEGKDEEGEEGEDKNENEDEDEYLQLAAAAQQSFQYQTTSYSHSNKNAPMQYTHGYTTYQQPAPPSTPSPYTHQPPPPLSTPSPYTHQPPPPLSRPSPYTHQPPSYLESAQQVASLPAQPVNQRKVRHIRTGIDGREDEALDPRRL